MAAEIKSGDGIMAKFNSYKDHQMLKASVERGTLDPAEATFLFKMFNPNSPDQNIQLDEIIKHGMNKPALKYWISLARDGRINTQAIHSLATGKAILDGTRVVPIQNITRKQPVERYIDTEKVEAIRKKAIQRGLSADEIEFLIPFFRRPFTESFGALHFLIENRNTAEIRKIIADIQSGNRNPYTIIRTINRKITTIKRHRRLP